MRKTLLATALLASAGAAQAITIEFDYSYDNTGFFTSQHVAIMDSVASELGMRITDSLAAITSSGPNSYQAAIGLVSNTDILTGPISVAADTIRVYVGADALGGTTLGIGGSGYNAGGFQNFIDLVRTRGQAEPASENFTPVSGQIVFDTETTWYLDDDVSTVEGFGGFDFYSIVLHEMGHVLGLGASDAWDHDVSGTSYTGANAMAAYGGPVPLIADTSHLDKSIVSSFMGGLQEPAMTASISAGQRKYFTELDWALLADVGWQVTAVPEAHSWAMMLAGLGLLGWRLRRRAA
jgi:MYXO-CTERM domain-containing protein